MIESSLSHATGSFAAMALSPSLCPIFCRSEPQFPTGPAGRPRTQNVLNLNDEKTYACTHINTYHEKMSKMVPYRGSDDLSIYPLELIIEH